MQCVSLKFHTANPSKRIEESFLDLRNMFSSQENIRMFSQNKKNKLRKIFLSLLQENFTWNKNISQNKTNFLNIKKTFLARKYFLFQENSSSQFLNTFRGICSANDYALLHLLCPWFICHIRHVFVKLPITSPKVFALNLQNSNFLFCSLHPVLVSIIHLHMPGEWKQSTLSW